MTMRYYKYLILGGIISTMGLSSCVGDLNVEPQDATKKTELTSKEEYLQDLAGCYYGLVKEGGITSGATGGESVYTRLIFNVQELCTDECVIAANWNDAGIDELDYALPGSENHWIYDTFSRLNAYIAICNQFLKDINGGGAFFTDDEIKEMKAEVRVLRDLGYYHMIDLFGRGPWTDENSIVGATPPTYDRQQLFDAVVNDLVDAIPQVYPASKQEYGRVSREAGYALLAKMYLNAEVYTGTARWQECADACQQIVNSGLKLADNYKYLFCASNAKHVASSTYGVANEIIWSVPQNDITMQCWGGTTYLSVGAYAAAMPAEMKTQLACTGGPWNGPHMRPETVNNFATQPNDVRYMFYDGDGLFVNDIKNLSSWGQVAYQDNDGLMCIKYTYTNEDDYYNTAGAAGMSANDFNSADTPVFRLADIYLMMTECQMNGANVDGLKYYNEVRKRAGVSTVTSLPTKQELLNERNRELYWEGHRRSDMIRLGFYTGSAYIWKWKGGVYEGTSIPEYRKLMPIPPQFVETLGQNPGY